MKRFMTTVTLLVFTAVGFAPGSTEAQKRDDAPGVVSVVNWTYYTGRDKHLILTDERDNKNLNIFCTVIKTEARGEWVCLFVKSFPEITLPEGVNADSIRPIQSWGEEFKLTGYRMCPKSDVTQSVIFYSAGRESNHKLSIKTDGTVWFEAVGTPFNGKTKLSGSVSASWFVPKE